MQKTSRLARLFLPLLSLAALLAPASASAESPNETSTQYLVSGDLCYTNGAPATALAEAFVTPIGYIGPFSKAHSSISYTLRAIPPKGYALSEKGPQWVLVNRTSSNWDSEPLATQTKYATYSGYETEVVWLSEFTNVNAPTLPYYLEIAPCFEWLKYQLRYHKNTPNAVGHDSTLSTNLVYTNTVTLAKTPANWTRSHYTLTGLSLSTDATEATWAFGETVASAGEAFDATTNGVVTLYAVWQPRDITITLDPGDGATVLPTSVRVVGAETCPELPTPTKTGYTFAGWYLPDGKTQILPGDEIESDEDISLTAKWKINSYTVEFDANGGSGGWTRTLEYGAKIEPPTPTRTGWEFTGWDPTPAETVPASDVTYTARWGALDQYIVTFVYTNSTGAVTKRVKVNSGDSAVPPADYNTNIGYHFVSWDKPLDGITSTQTITARYIPNLYTVAFDANGGKGEFDEDYFYYGEEWTLPANPFTFERGFLGWYTNATESSVSKIWSAGAAVSNLTAEADGRVTVYAIWERPKHDATFVWRGADGEEVSASVTVLEEGLASVPDSFDGSLWPGHTFSNWDPYPATTPILEPTTFTAVYSANEYSVYLDANCDSDIDADFCASAGTPSARDASAAYDLYLSPDGDDGNDGLTAATAKRTIAGCYAAATGDAVVRVAAGDYAPPENYDGSAVHEERQFIPVENRLTFVAVEGPGKTFITGAFDNDQRYADGRRHTLAFKSGPQTFDGFTIRKMDGFRNYVGADNSAGVAPAFACVVLSGCVVEDCDVRWNLSYGAFNSCFITNTLVRDCRFTGLKSANSHGAFNACEIAASRFEGVTFDAAEYRASGKVKIFGEGNHAADSLFSLSFGDGEKDFMRNAASSSFERCVFRWTYLPGYRKVRDESATNCVFAVRTGPYPVEYDAEWTLPENPFTRDGWKFLGWAGDADATAATAAPGDSVKNLAADDGASVSFYAVWEELPDEPDPPDPPDEPDPPEYGDLATAANANFELYEREEGFWSVASDQSTKGGSSIKASNPSSSTCVTGVVHGVGVISFKWRVEGKPNDTSFGYGTAVLGKNIFPAKSITDKPSAGEWTRVSVGIGEADADTTVWWFVYSGSETTLWLDEITWTPSGAVVEPTDADRPDISGFAPSSSGGFSISVSNADAAFDYVVLTNSVLGADAEWGEMKRVSGSDAGTIDLPRIDGEAAMFYKVKVEAKR